MKFLKIICKEPLTLFLVLGGFLYVIYQKTAPILLPDEVVINKNDLINYMQYQANGFNRKTFEAKYQALSTEEKQKLLEQFTQWDFGFRSTVSEIRNLISEKVFNISLSVSFFNSIWIASRLRFCGSFVRNRFAQRQPYSVIAFL